MLVVVRPPAEKSLEILPFRPITGNLQATMTDLAKFERPSDDCFRLFLDFMSMAVKVGGQVQLIDE